MLLGKNALVVMNAVLVCVSGRLGLDSEEDYYTPQRVTEKQLPLTAYLKHRLQKDILAH